MYIVSICMCVYTYIFNFVCIYIDFVCTYTYISVCMFVFVCVICVSHVTTQNADKKKVK